MKISQWIPATTLAMLLLPALAGAVTHHVNQVGFTFVPALITVEAGDTVQWNWATGSHTVTSGTNLADPQVGLLFDAPLNLSNTSFSFVFTDSGEQDYFCRPHLLFGMTGTVTVIAAAGVEDTPRPTGVQLLANRPNPFNPSTEIRFDLPADRNGPIDVSLRVFDLKGSLVRVLLDEMVDDDRRTVVWDGRDRSGKVSPSGVYVYRLSADGKTESRTMTLAK